MNFGDLKASVSYLLDDLQFGYFTTPQVGIWLNNAQREVQKRLIKAGQNYYVKRIQTTLVVNQRDYVLPQDFKKEHRLEIIMSGTEPNETVNTLAPITVMQQDLVPSLVGTPAYYFFKKNRITVQPAPDTALTLRMYYTYLVTDMSLDTDVPDVPESYHELLVFLAAQDGFIKDGRENALLIKKINEYQSDMNIDANERNQDQVRMIVETGFSSESGNPF